MRYSKLIDGIHKSKHSTWRHMGKKTRAWGIGSCAAHHQKPWHSDDFHCPIDSTSSPYSSLYIPIIFSPYKIHIQQLFSEKSGLRFSSPIFDLFILLKPNPSSSSNPRPFKRRILEYNLAPFQHAPSPKLRCGCRASTMERLSGTLLQCTSFAIDRQAKQPTFCDRPHPFKASKHGHDSTVHQ